MGRTDSGRAIDRKDARGEIVYAARRAWEGEPALRRLAIAATLALLVIDAAAFILLGGGAPLLVVLAGLVATTVPFALVVAAFRATALACFGDARPTPEPLSETFRRAAPRAPELLTVSWRAVQGRDARTPLTAPIVVVNGVSANEAARTSRALMAHRFGAGAALRVTTTLTWRFVVPTAAADVVVLFAAPSLGAVARPLVALAVAATTVVIVVVAAADAALRGMALRAARGDERALAPAVATALIRGSEPRPHRQPLG